MSIALMEHEPSQDEIDQTTKDDLKAKHEEEIAIKVQEASQRIMNFIQERSLTESMTKSNLKLDTELEKQVFKFTHDYMKRKLKFMIHGIKSVKNENVTHDLISRVITHAPDMADETPQFFKQHRISFKTYLENIRILEEEKKSTRELHFIYSMLRGSSSGMIEGPTTVQSNKMDADVYLSTANHIINVCSYLFFEKKIKGKIKSYKPKSKASETSGNEWPL